MRVDAMPVERVERWGPRSPSGSPALVVSLLLIVSCGSDSDANLEFRRSGSERVVRGPQLALSSKTTMLVAWTSDEATVGGIDYGETPELGLEVVGSTPVVQHVFTLRDLRPRTLYHYQLKHSGEVVSDGHFFSTVPEDDRAPLRFVVFGDSGTGSAAQRDVAAQVLLSMPDLVLITGDVVYDSGAPHELDPHYFVPYQRLIDRIPFYVALGNHDIATDGGRPLLDALHLPVNDRDGSERFYSFDRGHCHFVALETTGETAPGSVQGDWLEANLAATSATWIFVFFHHPPFSSSRHGSELRVRFDLSPVFDRHGVDLVFSGHDHDYERTFPLRGEQVFDVARDPDHVDPGGPIYVVTGGGGNEVYENGSSEFTAHSASVHHLVQIDVDGLVLTLRAFSSVGQIFDRMTLTKSQP